MIDVKQALDIVSNKQAGIISGIMETEDEYVFAIDNGEEGYTTVSKTTGSLGFIWIWDAMNMADKGIINKLDMNDSNHHFE